MGFEGPGPRVVGYGARGKLVAPPPWDHGPTSTRTSGLPEDPLRRTALALALLALPGLAFSATPVAAQLGGWTVGATADVGGYLPLRQLGKNAGTIPQLPVLQVVADRQSSLFFGGGLLFTSPSGETTVRARYSTTVGGVVSGRLGVCGEPDNPLFRGPLCEPVETDSDVRSFSVDLGFLQGSPGDRIRASLHLGGGLRSFSFGTIACEDPTDWEIVCDFTSEIWQDDGGIAPFLMGGLRLNGQMGPAQLWVEAMDQVGRYQGGSERADGNLQNDISVTAGFTLRVF